MKLVSQVLREVRTTLGVETAMLARKSGDDWIVLRADDDALGIEDGLVMHWDDTLCSQVLAGTAPRMTPVIDDVPAMAAVRDKQGIPLQAWFTAPLCGSDGELLGTLCATSLHKQPESAREKLPLLELLASMLGSLLSYEVILQGEKRKADQARGEAERDTLTGLGNRRRWDRILAAEDQRCRTYELPAAIIVLDADNLKEINDAHGHHAGDAVLRTIGGILRDVLREDDFAARVGGDEFAILLTGIGPDHAELICSRIVALLRAAWVQVSVGTAARSPGQTLREVWIGADNAMYQEKHQTALPQGYVPSHAAPHQVDDDTAIELLTRTATNTEHASDAVHALVAFVKDRLGLQVAMISEIDGDKLTFRYVQGVWPGADWAVDGTVLGPDTTSFCQWVIDQKAPILLTDTFADPQAREIDVARLHGLRAYAGAPIVLSSGEMYGTLCCFGPDPAPDLTSRDLELVTMVAATAAHHLERARDNDRRRSAVRERIDELLRREQMEVDYQPIVDVWKREVLGHEALARFPERYPLGPQEWLDEADEIGLGDSLELLLASSALAALDRLDGFLALNFSASTILTPGFARLMNSTQIDRLLIEISEHEDIPNYAAVNEALAPLRARGLRIAVDDVGAGFSSLRHVLQLKPEIIKLDMTLLKNIDSDPNRRALATALATFARQTDATVVAEGIETRDELRTVRETGINAGQGFFLGRPAPLPIRA